MILKEIDTILFDLGGVLLNVDIDLTINEFAKHSPEIKDFVYDNDILTWNNLLETGGISLPNFRKNISKKFNLSISEKEFDKCWNTMLLSIPQNRIDILNKLKQNYKLILVSNTNEIHSDYYEKQDYWSNNYFDKIYYSHEIGIRKPNIEVFHKIINENKLNPNQTIFFDDRIENLDAAEKTGIKTVLIGEKNIEDILDIIDIFPLSLK